MQILHGTWIPVAAEQFLCAGQFYLWVETSQKLRKKGDRLNFNLSVKKEILNSRISEKYSNQYLIFQTEVCRIPKDTFLQSSTS